MPTATRRGDFGEYWGPNANVDQRGAMTTMIQDLLNDGEIHVRGVRAVAERYFVKYFTNS